jgi:hypothetical protein
MLGSNPSADSVASTVSGGMLRHPPFAARLQRPPIGRGIKALNPGGAGAKPPQAAQAPKLPSEVRAPSHNAYVLRGQGLRNFFHFPKIVHRTAKE